uniref:Uncharacterized protein n=1 Tax=Desertifilum tharense IPPAS B-1220 TaxID=1781255 RepID=A0A1E5QQP8_9CYAN|nr:hypothetical protein BH720_03610 [Desertifilum tharense IPPAS B-1220]
MLSGKEGGGKECKVPSSVACFRVAVFRVGKRVGGWGGGEVGGKVQSSEFWVGKRWEKSAVALASAKQSAELIVIKFSDLFFPKP